jgi:hypothetical protein
MVDEIAQIENNIIKLTDSEFGEKYNIVLSLSQLEEISIKSYSKLQELMRSGEAIMRQYPLSSRSGTFSLIATSSEKQLFNFVTYLTFLVPLAAIILGFTYSWWFLLLLFVPIFTTRSNKRIYLHALFNRAANSEIAFCFLFCGKCITLELPDQGIIKRNA